MITMGNCTVVLGEQLVVMIRPYCRRSLFTVGSRRCQVLTVDIMSICRVEGTTNQSQVATP